MTAKEFRDFAGNLMDVVMVYENRDDWPLPAARGFWTQLKALEALADAADDAQLPTIADYRQLRADVDALRECLSEVREGLGLDPLRVVPRSPAPELETGYDG